MLDLEKLGIFGNLATSNFLRQKSCIILSSGRETVGFDIKADRVISLLAVYFPMLILGNSRMLLTSRDNQLLGKLIIFEKLLAFWTLMEWIEKTLHIKAASKWVSFCPKYLVKECLPSSFQNTKNGRYYPKFELVLIFKIIFKDVNLVFT